MNRKEKMKKDADSVGYRVIIKAPERIQDLAKKYLIQPNRKNNFQ